jgi:hypothetical protein
MLLQLSTSEVIAIWAIGVPVGISIIGYVIYMAFKFGSVTSDIESIKNSVKETNTTLNKAIFSYGQLQIKVEELWRQKITKSESPMVLNEVGKKILLDSKIDDLTEKYFTEILLKVKSLNPENPYQAQEHLISVLGDFKDREECRNDLENAAFKSGYNVETILFVAALNIRDHIINDLGFNRDDIDKFDPSNTSKEKV